MATTMAEELQAVADKHLGPKREELKELKKRVKNLEAEISSGDALLTAVRGGGKKKAISGKKKSGKPSADDKQCLGFMAKVISENPGIAIKEAIGLATSKMGEGGFTTQGQYQRLKAMIEKGDQFEVKGGKCSVAKPQ